MSVVTATYNRANVLRFTVESLRAQTVRDWELIVVGDACTDETAEVIRSFDDPRIHFHNREVNSGEQATPNNDGVRLSRGKYLAFLNHDDLWAPNHLAVCVEAIESTKADLIWTGMVAVGADRQTALSGMSEAPYSPYLFLPASSWLMRRELADRVGPWRPAREIFVAPSQDWLFRAWKKGAVMRAANVPTVLAVCSLSQTNAYAERRSEENAKYAARLENPAFIASLASEIASRDPVSVQPTLFGRLRRAAGDTIRAVLLAAGCHPHSLSYAMRFRRRGGYIDWARKLRGLGPLPRTGDSA